MSHGVHRQLRQPCHRAVAVLDLADHPGWVEAGQTSQIDRCFGVTSPLQHPALLGPQRKDVAGTAQIVGPGVGMDRHLNGAGPILRGDAGAHPVLRTRIHAHGESGLVAVGVAIHHQRQIEGIEPLTLHRQADQAPCLDGHEVDLLGRGELGRADQVALVFAVLVVDHHDRLAVADRRQGIGDRVETDAGVLGGEGLVAQEGQRSAGGA